MLDIWKQRARKLKAETYAIYLAYRDPRVPWYAKLWTACVVAYAFSPVDLIPDFIPVLGYLDDMILVPLGIALAIKMIPPAVLAECRQKAQTSIQDKPTNWAVVAIIVAIWVLVATIIVLQVLPLWRKIGKG